MEWNAASDTRRTPDSTVRPIAGKAGVMSADSQANASAAMAISAPTLPRRVESIFLKRRAGHEIDPQKRWAPRPAPPRPANTARSSRSEEHTSELQSLRHL